MLAAPELVIAEFVELLHEIEVAAELQGRMLADRVMRGEEGSEFQAGHVVFSQAEFVIGVGAQATWWQASAQSFAGSRRLAECGHAQARWIAAELGGGRQV